MMHRFALDPEPSRWIPDLVILIVGLVVGALSWLVPKRRGQIVFYPTADARRYQGNLRALHEHMADDADTSRTLLWLTRSAEVADRLRGQGHAVHLSRWRPFWTLLRADVIVMDGTERRLGPGRFHMVQLWHGTGFKAFGLRNPRYGLLRKAALRAHYRQYRLISANNPDDAQRKADCFGNDRVRVTGSPRNDMLLAGHPETHLLAERLDLNRFGRIIAYCPTYRASNSHAPFSDRDWSVLNARMASANAILLVKRHPNDRALRVPPGLPYIRDVTRDVDDVQRLLALSDMLLTDYSSIATDFALMRRPIIFFMHDEQDYAVRDQALYFDLRSTLPGPFVRKASDLADWLVDTRWFDEPAYRARYARFRDRFHSYQDDGATARVARLVDGILAEAHRPSRIPATIELPSSRRI